MFQLAEKYRGEFAELYDSLSRQSSELGDGLQQNFLSVNAKLDTIEPKLKFYRKEMTDSLQNREPVANVPSATLLPIFSWAFVLHLGYFIASIVGGTLLYPLVGLVFGRFSASLLVYVFLPVYVLYYLNNVGQDSDKDIRFRMLAVAIAQGLLVGFLFSHRHLITIQPPCFLGDLAVAMSAVYLAPLVGTSRIAVLGALSGSIFAAHFALGLALGQLSFPYVFMAILHSAIAYSTLQFHFRFQSDVTPYVYMLGFFVASLYVELLLVLIFGISHKESN